MGLARRLNKPFFELLAWPQSEIVAQMAYDRACDPDFAEAAAKERFAALPEQQRAAIAMRGLKQIFKDKT